METRANFVLIGAFVLTAIVAVVAFVLWLGTSQLNREFARYDVVFDGPVSLEEGAAVRYIGIKVGEVESVRIDRRDAAKVRARIRIDKQTPVKADSTAVIDFAGITGVTFLQITAGSSTAGPLTLQPYQDVPLIKAGETPLVELFSSGAEIAGRASMLLTDENIEALGVTLSNVESITSTLASDDEALVKGALETLVTLNRAGDRLARASDAATSLAGSLDEDLDTMNVELAALVEELRVTTQQAGLALTESRKALEVATSLIDEGGTNMVSQGALAAQDLRVLIARLDRLTRNLEQHPESFVVGDPKPYEDRR